MAPREQPTVLSVSGEPWHAGARQTSTSNTTASNRDDVPEGGPYEHCHHHTRRTRPRGACALNRSRVRPASSEPPPSGSRLGVTAPPLLLNGAALARGLLPPGPCTTIRSHTPRTGPRCGLPTRGDGVGPFATLWMERALRRRASIAEPERVGTCPRHRGTAWTSARRDIQRDMLGTPGGAFPLRDRRITSSCLPWVTGCSSRVAHTRMPRPSCISYSPGGRG